MSGNSRNLTVSFLPNPNNIIPKQRKTNHFAAQIIQDNLVITCTASIGAIRKMGRIEHTVNGGNSYRGAILGKKSLLGVLSNYNTQMA